MSHFAVLVIGPNPESQLAPFHEFECTGLNNQYVQDIDMTEEMRESYNNETVTRLQLADGTLTSFFTKEGKWKPEYSQPDPNPRAHDPDYRIKFIPEDCKEVEVKTSQVMGFAEYCEGEGYTAVEFGQEPDIGGPGRNDGGDHKYRYYTVNENGEVVKVVKRTNPNAEWDWYSVGGRWSGYFKMKAGAQGDVGTPGVFQNVPEPGHADVLLKGAIDVEGQRDDEGKSAGEQWDRVRSAAGDITGYVTWKQMREEVHKGDIEAARKAYGSQPSVQRLEEANKGNNRFMGIFDSLDNYLITREEYVHNARDLALAPFAFVKDSRWCARGDMGWWGMSIDNMTGDEWAKQFAAMFDALPDDTELTLVDCHI